LRDSFAEMMETVDRVQEKLAQFIEIGPNLSFKESYAELIKCKEFTDKIDKKLKERDKIKTDSINYATDLAAYLMCRVLSLMYEHTALVTFTSNLKEELIKARKPKKKKHVNKFTKS
jgi:hypothetical protein